MSSPIIKILLLLSAVNLGNFCLRGGFLADGDADYDDLVADELNKEAVAKRQRYGEYHSPDKNQPGSGSPNEIVEEIITTTGATTTSTADQEPGAGEPEEQEEDLEDNQPGSGGPVSTSGDGDPSGDENEPGAGGAQGDGNNCASGGIGGPFELCDDEEQPETGGEEGGGGGGGDPSCANQLSAQFLGTGMGVSDHDSSLYTELNGGPVVVEGDLDCDVDNKCCWDNAAVTLDQLNFKTGSSIDAGLLQTAFGVDTPPDGKFMVASSSCAQDPMFEGHFVSCSIVCTNEPVRVSLMHWSTADAKIQVCTRDSFYNNPGDNPLLHCVDIDKTESPGPSLVQMPPGEVFDVVIAVSNFVGALGDVVMLDNIRIDYVLCPELPATLEPSTDSTDEPSDSSDPSEPPDSSEQPQSDPGAECAAIECDFEDGTMCQYEALEATEENRKFFRGPLPDAAKEFRKKVAMFRVYKGRIFNYVTGIYAAGEGEKYTAVYLRTGKAAIMKTTTTLTEARIIRFKYYEATNDFELFLCCVTSDGGRDCQAASEPVALPSDRKWKDVQFKCDAQTSEIYFMCTAKNSKMQGACGIDHIKLYEYDGSTFDPFDPLPPATPVCS